MFWIALELRNSNVGFIIRLSKQVKRLTLFEIDGVAKYGNTGVDGAARQGAMQRGREQKRLERATLPELIV